MRIALRLVASALALALAAGCSPSALTPSSAPSGGSGGAAASGGSGAPSGGTGSAAAGRSNDPVATLITDRCTRCHSLDRIRRASHDEAGWQSTISRMRGKGAQVDDAQASQIAKFLAGGGGAQL